MNIFLALSPSISLNETFFSIVSFLVLYSSLFYWQIVYFNIPPDFSIFPSIPAFYELISKLQLNLIYLINYLYYLGSFCLIPTECLEIYNSWILQNKTTKHIVTYPILHLLCVRSISLLYKWRAPPISILHLGIIAKEFTGKGDLSKGQLKGKDWRHKGEDLEETIKPSR